MTMTSVSNGHSGMERSADPYSMFNDGYHTKQMVWPGGHVWMDRHTDRHVDECYHVHYLPAYLVEKYPVKVLRNSIRRYSF